MNHWPRSRKEFRSARWSTVLALRSGFIWSLPVFLLAAPVAAFATGKQEKSKARTNSGALRGGAGSNAEAASSQDDAAPAGLVETRLARDSRKRLVPGEQGSVAAGLAINPELGKVSEEGLLKQGRSLKPRGGDIAVSADRKILREARRAERSLGFGAFRNESLADGAVSAPSIEDFAAFFNASSTATTAGSAKKEGVKSQPSAVRLGERDQEYMTRQASAEKLRVQTVASIRTIIATNPAAEQRLNLLMRLAEIQVESHSYTLELEIQTFNRAYDEWFKSRKGAEPKFSDKASKAKLLAGIEALRTASTDFPGHARAPEILFNLGFLLNQVGSDSAKLYFDRLVKNFPKSDYVPKAYLALGEFYFQRSSFRDALKNYQAVLNYKGTESYNYAVYKIGWSYFNLPGRSGGEHRENLQKSLAAFQLVVKLADAPEASVILKGLRGEALKDMILVFVDLKDIPAAERFYASLGEKDLYFTFLERLAWQSGESGEFDGSVAIYRKLILEAPTHKRMPIFLSRLIEAQEKRLDYQAVLGAMKYMSDTLAKEGAWHAAHAADSNAIAQRNESLQKAFNYWPKFLHAQAQKTKRPEYYNYALDAYQVHIQNFPQDAGTYDSYFYSGEIYVYLKRHEDAATQYAKAVGLDEKFKLGSKLTKEAILNGVASLDLAIGDKPPVDLPEPGKSSTVIPLPALQARLVWFLDAFVRLYPAEEQATGIAHRAARYNYAYGDYASAQARWLALAKSAPKSNEAADGIRLSLRVHLNREDWKVTREVGSAFLAIPGVKEAYISRDIVAVMKVAQFQLALKHEAEKKHLAAEAAFLGYQKEYPEDPDAPKALFNAANNAFKHGNMDSAVRHLKTILSQYGRSDVVADALYQIATSMDTLGQFSESAAHYEQLFQKHSTHKLAESAAFRSIQQRHALGQTDVLQASGRAFLAKWPVSKFAPEVWSLLGRSLDERSRFGAAADTYVEAAGVFLSKQPAWAVYFYAQAALSGERAGRETDRSRFIALGLKTFDKMSRDARDQSAAIEGVSRISQSRLQDVEKEYLKVIGKKITDGLKLTDQFSLIRADVERVANQYVEIVKLGNAEAGIQALFRVAELQAYLSVTLLNAPVPPGASAVEAEQFRGTLERIALPLQEEAANLFLTAWERAKETEAMTPFTSEIYKKLAELRPSEYRKIDARIPVPSYFGTRLLVNNDTKSVIEN